MEEKRIHRLEAKYNNLSDKFILKSFNYINQFSHIYSYRLAEMSKLLTEKIEKKWSTKYPIKKIFELREDFSSSMTIVLGAIYKHQEQRHSILHEIADENQLAPQPQRLCYSDPKDKIFLEDELQRVRLRGKIDCQQLATGIICAVLGTIEEGGQFSVEDIMYYESGPQKPLKMLDVKAEEHVWLVLVSGLDQLDCDRFADSLDLFQHWLDGNIKNRTTYEPRQVVKLIVAGNSLRTMPEAKTTTTLQMRRPQSSNQTLDAMMELDKWFASWSETISIDLMAGEFDPSNYLMPQQPLHRCMFPNANVNSSFQCVTNPYACEINGTHIIGCSGQNIKDILRVTSIEKPLEALRSTLIWSHIVPTAPDTVACYPYANSDPFIMSECPHIYFAGNCDEYATEMHEGTDGQSTRLICVPSFAKTQSVALVNLNTLECRKIAFQSMSQ